MNLRSRLAGLGVTSRVPAAEPTGAGPEAEVLPASPATCEPFPPPLALLGASALFQPPPTVRERLHRMGSGSGGGGAMRAPAPARLEDLEGARLVGTAEAGFIRIERPVDRAVSHAIDAWCARFADHGPAIFSDPRLAGRDPRRALFFDTETTGLGGAACLVFLLGGVHLGSEGAVCTQFLMREPVDERPMLASILDFLSGFDLVVSYNGRGFDARMMADRFIMAGMPEGVRRIEEMAHLDLLPPARRLFRFTLDDCRLVTIERDVLGRDRGPDVDGSLIPSIYYDWMRTRRPEGLQQVIEHNAHDVESLAMLAARVLEMVAHGERVEDPESSLGLGRLLVEAGRAGEGEEALRRSLESSQPATRYRARKHLADLLKRRGALDDAALVWRDMAAENVMMEAHPHTELAKYHEHHLRDYAEALRLVEEALDNSLLCTRREREMLQQRRCRLQKKASAAFRSAGQPA